MAIHDISVEERKILKAFNQCKDDPFYFISNYCKIFDAESGEWIPFDLWDEQEDILQMFFNNQLSIVLKARQLGLTWIALAYILWCMLFRPITDALIFSRRDTEAMYLLDERLKGMYKQLPEWMKWGYEVVFDSSHKWQFNTGSTARAFPTTAGDSYTATIAFVDEADLVPDLNRLMRAVKPTIDGGGQMILVSRSDKSKPQSEFKNIYRAAKKGTNTWAHAFLPWDVRPGRDKKWYASIKADIISRTGSDDDLFEQYPATDTEALTPRTLDKRIPSQWLEKCFLEVDPFEELPEGCPSIPGLEIYQVPITGKEYVIGIDPAEGNPTSDPSALTVMEVLSGEEVAKLAGRIQPAVMASYADQIGTYYNNAALMPERNNHGHAVILWLHDNSELSVLHGLDNKPGWMSSSKGKALLYSAAADAFRDGDTILHSFDTFTQLANIEGSSLLAPEGEFDDLADSYALAVVGVHGKLSAWLFTG